MQKQFVRALPRCRPHSHGFARQASTATTVEPKSSPLPPPRVSATRNAREDESERCSAIVITKTRIASMVDAYAIIRAIEQKYGTLREYQFPREVGSPNVYTNQFYVVFKSPESHLKLPKSATESITIPAPTPDTFESKPGGPSLADFHTLLDPKGVDTSNEIPAFESIIDTAISEGGNQDAKPLRAISFSIFQARKEFHATTPWEPYGLRRQLRFAIGRSMLNWGGFYPLKPVLKGSSLEYGVSDADQLRMRRLLRKWSDITQAPNPFEVSSVVEASTTPEVSTETPPPLPESQKPTEWEPLPVEDAVADEVPVPVPQSPPASASPQASKRPTRLGGKLLPSTSQASAIDADLLIKASESLLKDPAPPTQAKRVREKKAKTQQHSPKVEDDGFSQRFKKFIGGWF
ncbi:hypothetical protein CCMSSC00406_0007367 [Pleurotus cornucopiae]|uniref:Uncharacterized protein n=1 Tax=Pleurotus cornucopiae TaxID=5321 RepID=A0ACB7IU77_PLECO|nr:hypothetical protein CCMSSC00406_0007367 [Pleurotus cornucopiae]